jgi:hypothetical protein
MTMHDLNERVKRLLDQKVEEVINKGDISPSEMECIYKAYKTKYYMTTTEAMEDYGEDESSYRRGYSMGYPDPYTTSMRRGRGADGRYVSRGGNWNDGYDMSYTNDNRGGNRSMHSVNDRIIANLERELNSDISDFERQKITEEIRRLREMKD